VLLFYVLSNFYLPTITKNLLETSLWFDLRGTGVRLYDFTRNPHIGNPHIGNNTLCGGTCPRPYMMLRKIANEAFYTCNLAIKNPSKACALEGCVCLSV
jgi:hypothetical protein